MPEPMPELSTVGMKYGPIRTYPQCQQYDRGPMPIITLCHQPDGGAPTLAGCQHPRMKAQGCCFAVLVQSSSGDSVPNFFQRGSPSWFEEGSVAPFMLPPVLPLPWTRLEERGWFGVRFGAGEGLECESARGGLADSSNGRLSGGIGYSIYSISVKQQSCIVLPSGGQQFCFLAGVAASLRQHSFGGVLLDGQVCVGVRFACV